MKESDIHKLLLSFGMLPMLTILKELENEEDYNKCILIRDGINSFKLRFTFIFSEEKELETEEDYYNYYENLKKGCGSIAKSNLSYYIKECRKKLEI